MALNLLDVVKRICVSVGINDSITAFSATDETLTIVQFINEAMDYLVTKLPAGCPYFNTQGNITTVASQRLYSPPSNFFAPNLAQWSVENETSNDVRLQVTTLESLRMEDSKYDETVGQPQSIYLDGSSIGVYPVPDGAYTINFDYSQGTLNRLSNTTDTFGVPDKWVFTIEKMAQVRYESFKGYATVEETKALAQDLLEETLVDAWELENTYWM